MPSLALEWNLAIKAVVCAATKSLNQAVTRNMNRFPPDFMLRVLRTEKEQLVTNCDRFGLLKHSSVMPPRASTEQGVAMFAPLNVEPV